MSLAAAALTVIFACSCRDEEEFTTGEFNGEAVYFPTDVATEYTLDENTASVSIPVRRSMTDGEFTISIFKDMGEMTEADQSIFTVPESVTFAEGESETALVIAIDKDKVEEGKEYTIGFLLNDEANVSQYGNKSLYITMSMESWELLGTGKFRDDWFTAMWTNSAVVEVDVPIYEHITRKGLYKIESPYGWPYLTEFFGGEQEAIEAELVTYTDTDITVDASNAAQVTIARQFTGITDNDPAYGPYEISTAESAYGTLEDGVISFPADGLMLYCTAGSMSSNPDGMFRIVLPGYEARDYSLSASYSGMRVASDNTTASAVFDFTYGDDVTGISYVFASGDITADPSAVVASVADGTAENIYEVENFVQGGETVSVEADIQPGVYTLVALPVDASGALSADDAAVHQFYFPGAGGSSAPECDIKTALYKVSEYPDAAGYIETCPDYSSIVYEITGSELKSVKTYLNTTEVVNGIEDMGLTVQDIVDAYGADIKADFLQELNAAGKTWNIFINLDASTSYTFVVSAENIYGESALVISDPIVTAGLPYSGELVIGKYQMSCDFANEHYENVFEVLPVQDSETDFFVKNIGFANQSSWYAEYDPEAATLTLNGVEKGYEDLGSQFGMPYYYYDSEETMYYGFYSYASDSSRGKDPCVFAVDPVTKELTTLNNDFCVALQDANTFKAIGFLSYFTAGTKVSPYVESRAASHSGMTAGPASIKKLDRSTSMVTINRHAVMDKQSTLNVETRVCAPLTDGKEPGGVRLRKALHRFQ